MVLPTTRDRVPDNTADDVNNEIDAQITRRVRSALAQPADILQRLRTLDEEWDIERGIEMNASALAFIGIALGFFVHHTGWRFP